MSGNYGWGGRDRDADFTPARDTGFSRAIKPYANGPDPDAFSQANARNSAAIPISGAIPKAVSQAIRPVVDLSAKKHTKTTAKNVIVLAMDRTGSMGDWRAEIFQRLPLLFKESQQYLGEDVEVLFMGFGDLAMGDTIDVAPLGKGPELDTYLQALDKQESGGGNGVESSEIPAYYMAKNVDTSTARHVFYFTITDEGFYPHVGVHDSRGNGDATVQAFLGLRGGGEDSASIFQGLKVRANVFTILAQTGTVDQRIRDQWHRALGENVVPLDDARRVVDVLLGTIAKMAGLFDQFSVALGARQGGTQYGAVNIGTVHAALSHVVGPPQGTAVKAGTRSLMAGDPKPAPVPAPSQVAPKPGTRSLMAGDKDPK